MTEQNHGNRGIDVNELVRQDLARNMRRGNPFVQGLFKVARSLTGQPRIELEKSVPTVDWLQTKLVSRGSRNK